ncbi:MAG: MDR family oxidoreductase [Planktomarina sp.]|nr:MDR family oxidoreductase [Planktomarina sp.]
MFNALVVEKTESGTHAAVREISYEDLPAGDVTVAVEYSTVNYKDGLCIGSGGGMVRNYPHIPGIDMAGVVEASEDPRYKSGDRVVLTGWRYGEAHWGGYSQKTRVNANWLVALPDAISTKQAMAVGTAGITAMFSVMALEAHGLKPEDGPVLLTGVAGGVGSIAAAILSNLGYEVTGVTGRPETADYLKSLGVSQIIAREEVSETTKRPLESAIWAGCIDAVGGQMLARVLGQMKYGASVAAVGNAGGVALPANVLPFLLRGINLLGIDSVNRPHDNRVEAWSRIAKDLPMEKLEGMITSATLADLPGLGKDILKGQVRGRIVVDVNA